MPFVYAVELYVKGLDVPKSDP